jgi:hypothetical protein
LTLKVTIALLAHMLVSWQLEVRHSKELPQTSAEKQVQE